MANELARGWGNINKNKTTQKEQNKIVEQITQELRKSEYKLQTAKVVSDAGRKNEKTA